MVRVKKIISELRIGESYVTTEETFRRIFPSAWDNRSSINAPTDIQTGKICQFEPAAYFDWYHRNGTVTIHRKSMYLPYQSLATRP